MGVGVGDERERRGGWRERSDDLGRVRYHWDVDGSVFVGFFLVGLISVRGFVRDAREQRDGFEFPSFDASTFLSPSLSLPATQTHSPPQ